MKNEFGNTAIESAIGGFPKGSWKVFVDHYLAKGIPLVGGIRSEHLLFKALDKGDGEFIGYVLDHGAEAGVKDVFGHTLLDRALENGKSEIAKILCSKAAPHSSEYASEARAAGCRD